MRKCLAELQPLVGRQLEMMKRLDVPVHFISICQEIYHNSTQKVRSAEGCTHPIPVRRGIKQGCPLSPLLFNLVLEGILPNLERVEDGYKFGGGATIKSLAYADNLCIVGTTKDGINHMLGMIIDFFKWARLDLNPSKCGSLSMINNRKQKYVEPFEPNIAEGQTIPALKWDDTYRYLGVKLGRERTADMKDLAQEMFDTTEQILNSKLTDWQKIDALNTFVITKASYYLNATIVDQTWAASTDAKIRALTKKALRLPKRTLSTYLHTANQPGGLGLKSLEDARNTTLVSRVFSCLSSRDRKVQNIAWTQLTSTVKKRRGINEVSTRDIQDFLNHLPLPQERNSRDVKTYGARPEKLSTIYRALCPLTDQT